MALEFLIEAVLIYLGEYDGMLSTLHSLNLYNI